MHPQWITKPGVVDAPPATPAPWPPSPAGTDDRRLRALLGDVLARFFGFHRDVIGIARRVSPYSTSFTLEELDVRLADGARLALMCKDLGRASLLPAARRVRPEFLYDPLRELRVYDRVLRWSGVSTPVCYGVVADEASDSFLLFLERVPSEKLCHVGDFAVWIRVARWLGVAHARFAPTVKAARAHVPLLEYDARYYRLWLDRAAANVARAGRPGAAADVAYLARHYDDVARALAALPRTLIHGEFYPSNVLIQRVDHEGDDAPRVRVCPVDWEMAGHGPGLIDLAALVSGNWTAAQREAMAAAYHDALVRANGNAPRREEFMRGLEYCRLHLAVQWVGWSSDWSPPDDQARDWLGEAVAVARGLGL